MRVVRAYLRRQADELLLELDVWSKQLGTISQHVRVTCGDLIYKHTANVFILGEVLDQPSTSAQIVESIDCALELCSEASALRQVVMLVWPLLICGSFASPQRRDKVLGLVEAFREDYCDDLSVAKQLLLEQWRGQDAGEGRRSFAALMQAIGKQVLLI
ncbi:hypothetical protein FA10DRAFT_269980 [Acaromyces ingoldii]|uniref:Uncharacterized protein n=1 Tax=Acaromyces ingoldii TaxID=215250 RepID=A0A316YDG8_9BASI|nr:hypothetical protein FA10DRAFT_269980 [Acaromyces ingoldii]PWN86894.1 hypothetical protein FA10DRAFT_269980 [Acaromyces ingoldii]